MQKKYVEASQKDIDEYIITHIVKGDSGDGVPNILSKDDVFVNQERQKPVMKKRLAEFLEHGIDACRNDEEKRNYQRNSMLVNFKYMPNDVHNSIIQEYENYQPQGDKMKIMDYLIKNKCRLLLDDLEEF